MTTRPPLDEPHDGASQTTPETIPETHSDATDLPLDVVYGMLSNQRRRRALRFLLAESETTLGALAEHIAGIENEKPEDELSSSERKRVYICMYQCHLPKMDDTGIIDFDEDRKTIELGENAPYVMRYLPEQDDTDSSESERWWATSVVNFAQTASGMLPDVR